MREGLTVNDAFVEEQWGSSRPLIAEIGTGQGENIVAAASEDPDRNYLAVEVYDPGIAHTMLLAGHSRVTNLRIARVNAPELFAAMDQHGDAGDSTTHGICTEIWTFFPDPWPKMKHHKRRLIQPWFADTIHAALADGGAWRIATDIEDYALHVHEVMDDRHDFVNIGGITASLPLEHVGKGNAQLAAGFEHREFIESPRFARRVLTNFERKGIDKGRVIHDLGYRAC